MKNIFKKARKGFTIVELVIVVGVIAILSAILIPTFTNLTSKANEAALQSNLTNAYNAYVVKYAETDKGLTEQTKVYISEKSTNSTSDGAGKSGNAYHYVAQTDGNFKWVATTSAVENLQAYDADDSQEDNQPFLGKYYVYRVVA